MRSIGATDNPAEMIQIAMELRNRLPQLEGDELFATSIPQFLSLAGYKFVIAADDRSDEPCALGLLTFYKAPMIESIVLAVEAMWFRDESLEDQLWIWADLISYAQKLEFAAVCVAEKSVNTPVALGLLVQSGAFGRKLGKKYGVQRGKPVLQGTAPGLYSAFSEGAQSGSAFFAPCIVMAPLVPVNWGGVPSQSTEPLYRGEGRLKVDGAWDCKNYAELIDYFQKDDHLELLAAPTLSICCFRYRPPQMEETKLDDLNVEIARRLRADGTYVPSTTRVAGRLAIRPCYINPRTSLAEVDGLADRVREIGDAFMSLGINDVKAPT